MSFAKKSYNMTEGKKTHGQRATSEHYERKEPELISLASALESATCA